MDARIRQTIGAFQRCWFFIVVAASLLIVAPWPEPAAGKDPGWLGVTLTTVTSATKLPKGLSLASGALVLSVHPNGPAVKADLRPGDVILGANDRKIANADDLLKYVEGLGAGSTITITRARAGGGRTTVSVVLAAKPGSGELKPKTFSQPRPPAAKSPAAGDKPPKAPDATDTSPRSPVPDREISGKETLGQSPTGGQTMAPSSLKPEVMPERPKASPTIGAYERVPPPVSTEGGMEAPSRSSGSTAPSQPVTKNGGSVFKKRSFEYRAPTEESPPTGLTRDDQPYTTIKVFYATDRNKTDSLDPVTLYGTDRGTLRYGTCDVTVPKDHRVGELEAPSYLRLEFSEDPAKHVILSRVTEQASSDFYKDVGARVGASKGSSAVIFVHGYNVTFKDAARRTAQMSYDLKFDGAPVFFSWPSQGSYVGYPVDEANVEYARSDLKTFIVEFARNSTANQIYLVAHSMGNRALTGAITEVFREAPDVKAKIKEIILAAPDIDADVFRRDIAPAITGPGQAVTLYSSSNDLALKASKKFHGYARAGDTGQALTVVPGITTIDSSDVETDFLGHSYFAESTSIIADIFNILAGLTKPEERTNLVAVDAQAGRYWKLRRAEQ